MREPACVGQEENLETLSLRMCQDCVRDVFADGDAVCRKHAETILQTVEYELKQRKCDPASPMHLVLRSSTSSTDSGRCGSAPQSPTVQHKPPSSLYSRSSSLVQEAAAMSVGTEDEGGHHHCLLMSEVDDPSESRLAIASLLN